MFRLTLCLVGLSSYILYAYLVIYNLHRYFVLFCLFRHVHRLWFSLHNFYGSEALKNIPFALRIIPLNSMASEHL